jgi:hypothetical protein
MREDYVIDADTPRLRRDGGISLSSREERVEKAAVTLDNELDRLAERLQAVLGPDRPSPALSGDGPTAEPESDLARFLETTADRLNRLGARLAYTIDRIDL